MKATTAGAEFASAAWSVLRPSTVLADLTDLAALPALAVAWWTWTRVRHAELPERWTRTVRAMLVLPHLRRCGPRSDLELGNGRR